MKKKQYSYWYNPKNKTWYVYLYADVYACFRTKDDCLKYIEEEKRKELELLTEIENNECWFF